MEKLPFLLEKEYGIKVNHLLKYSPYLYGPYSPKVIEATYRLAYFGLIKIKEKVIGAGYSDEHVMRVYELTPEGQEIAEKFFYKFPEEVRNAFFKLKEPSSKPIRVLLKEVYTKYPEVRKYTRLDDFL